MTQRVAISRLPLIRARTRAYLESPSRCVTVTGSEGRPPILSAQCDVGESNSRTTRRRIGDHSNPSQAGGTDWLRITTFTDLMARCDALQRRIWRCMARSKQVPSRSGLSLRSLHSSNTYVFNGLIIERRTALCPRCDQADLTALCRAPHRMDWGRKITGAPAGLDLVPSSKNSVSRRPCHA